MELKRVVVTGLGAITPIGNTVDAYWQSLKSGVSGSQPITLFDASKFKTQFACEVKGFNPEDFLDKKEARKLDRYSQFAIVCADEAIKNAGWDMENINKDKIGVIWASGIGGLGTFYEEVMSFAAGDGTPRFNPFFIPKMIADIAAGHISMKHGFRGPNYCTVSACASSSHALMDAHNLIRLGKAQAFVVGGSEAAVNQAGMGGFNSMKALSERNESPQTASRPFDKERDGFVLGEGAGALILEEYEYAKARGANILAELVGTAASADAYHLTAPHPDGLGVMLVMNSALEDAGLNTTDVDYINVHGTSTPLGDVAELKAIQQVFGEHAYNLNISSTKSMTGHLLGAAGAIEAVATVLALQHNTVPPTINHSTPDEAIDPKLNLTLNTAQQKNIRVALSNTFGFGGHNATVIFKKLD
jgi:3-oxoacyl-[acyl-carrier-protein] synthase II